MQSSRSSPSIINDVICSIVRKTTVISKIPMKICFRDMDNDLSYKFFVAANKNKEF